MLRGFTLLELLITVLILSGLLFWGIPKFQHFQQQNKIVQLASELQGFLIQAKSEAVYRNQDLWAHVRLDTNPSSSGDWSIRLTNTDVDGGGTSILTLSGNKYRGIHFFSDYVSDQIKFDGVRGKITNGNFSLSLSGSPEWKLSLRSSFGASRIKVCGIGGDHYGYPKCIE